MCPKGRTDEKRLFSPNVCDDAGKVLRNKRAKAGKILFQKCGFCYSHAHGTDMHDEDTGDNLARFSGSCINLEEAAENCS